jgi:formylglycine-generating enzyme required for sulfatase activity
MYHPSRGRPGRKPRSADTFARESETAAGAPADQAVPAPQKPGLTPRAPSHVSRFTSHASTRRISRRFSAAFALAFLVAGPAARGFVYETEQQFLTTGDFDGDGKPDLAIVDLASGRARLGYQQSPGVFNWVDWRASDVKGVTGVSVGKLFDLKRDALAVTSADANKVTVLEAANPDAPTPPVPVKTATLGPNTVVAIDVGGAGNTPLQDLVLGSIYNSDPTPNRVTLFRDDGKTFTQISESPVTGPGAHANRLSLRRGGPEFAAAVVGEEKGDVLRVERFDGGKAEAVLVIGEVPAKSDYVVGNFRGQALKEFVFYKSGEANLVVRPVEEPSPGKFQAGPAKTFSLGRPVRQLVVIEGETKSRLLGIFGDQEPAEVMNFDGANPPVTVQKLAGNTNGYLTAAVALPDAVALFSTLTNDRPRPVWYYQIHLAKGDSFEAGRFGSLPLLTDRDDTTVPEIYKRILAAQTVKTAAEMKAYTNTIPGTDVKYEMLPIPAGEFVMGTPASEKDRKPDEGPQHKVKISPFWMGQYEVTWDQYLLFMYPDDEKKLREAHPTPEDVNEISDAVTRPSKPYVDMSFGMGKSSRTGGKGFPAIAMTQHGANKFCHWLSAKTGHFYRLPTEAEWEYACRAGTTTAYSFGDDPAKLGEYGWFFDNSDSKYREVGKKKPNPWGLFDMHGNVTEWVLDQFSPDYYRACADKGVVTDPWNRATKPYPHAVRGGSWDDDPPALRSGARRGSDRTWKMQDPQLPKSTWYLTDAQFVGFRIVRPLRVPPPEELAKYWTSGVEKD